SHGEFASLRNFDVIVNLQRNGDPITFTNQARAARNLADPRAGQQDVRAFQQTTRVVKSDGERVVSLEPFPQPAELHHQRAEHREAVKNKNAYFEFHPRLVPVHKWIVDLSE